MQYSYNSQGTLATVTDPAERAEIQAHIDARVATLKPTKTTEVNYDALPEELRSKYSKG